MVSFRRFVVLFAAFVLGNGDGNDTEHNLNDKRKIRDAFDEAQNLTWNPCYYNKIKFSCAKLIVPLDYADESIGTAEIAFIKADGAPGSPDMLFNPGGPAASGVDDLLNYYGRYREDFGIENGYNIVAFDPRGVKTSTPDLSCPQPISLEIKGDFPTYEEYKVISLAQAKLCNTHHGEGGPGKARYAGTAAVAADMLHFIKKSAESQGQNPDEATLNYYGLSYGAQLGATFAAMYPDKINRMVVDGVPDLESLYKGFELSKQSQADDILQFFFDTCAETSHCDFNNGPEDDSERIQERFMEVLELTSKEDEFVRHSTRWHIYHALYSPERSFPEMAALLKKFAIEFGVFNDSPNSTNKSLSKKENSQLSPRSDYVFVDDWIGPKMEHAFIMINCIDVNQRFKLETDEQWEAFYSAPGQSNFLPREMFQTGAQTCQMYDIQPPPSQNFTGFSPANKIQTSKRILFGQNRYDPVTPGASKSRTLFDQSLLLKLPFSGHCMTPSECSTSVLRRYWDQSKETNLADLVDPKMEGNVVQDFDCTYEKLTNPFSGEEFPQNAKHIRNERFWY
ncbi:hypothetical protein B0J11DRAFT_614991 [Dendryphion nanum]|uniref:AB hydrolase-1 domain-containing protein n=1 Tax=Dendryphion nanum TaxID=256645 RepID=A0A9P9DV64_9PLEO|nr:hypothetical protein B0J11DRAFT_614991 [Dendryphion nanum]